MSIEELIAAHTAALEANTKAVEANTKALGAAPKAATKPKAPTAAEKKAATEKAAAEMADEDAKEKKAPAKKAAPKKSDKITKKTLVDAFSGFLSDAQDDEDLLTERRASVKALSTHYEVAKISDLDESLYPEAMEALSSLLAGETPAILEAGEEESEDDDLV